MTLVRWNPYRALNNLESEIDSFFGDYGFGTGNERRRSWVPAADILERKNAYEVKLELPGVAKEDVKINLDENILTIQGEKKSEKNTEEENYNCCERVYGSFTRSFTLPRTVDGNKIEAEFKDGILKLNVPKTEQAKPKAIQIK